MFVHDMLESPKRRLGYAVSVAEQPRYIVYAEVELPQDRRARIDQNSAFADFDYALYLGDTPDVRKLLASSTGGDELTGRSAAEVAPFADTHLLLEMAPQKDLDGQLMGRLPWIFGVSGVLFTAAIAFLVERLARRRDEAEELAVEHDLLYRAQRSVAQTLQHSLLPGSLPAIEGVDIAARYIAGTEGLDVGGDWYDVVPLGGGSAIVAVGDVSGHGLAAATTMASLRYAMRAFAAQGDAPAIILSKLGSLLDVRRDGQFATVLCAAVEIATRRVRFASAGHPHPLLIGTDGPRYVEAEIGLPVGVDAAATYVETEVVAGPGATLLLYTDGLIERRGVVLDVGLDRLARATTAPAQSLAGLLDRIVREAIPQGADDDTAILGVRWS
jgi:serine phosphatase RsbU (regulator of sigma subunit)